MSMPRAQGQFIASKQLPAIVGSGSWFRVAEYCYTDQSEPKDVPYRINDYSFGMCSLIEGTLERTAQPRGRD